jgi:osmotically-inducible protein OsmY
METMTNPASGRETTARAIPNSTIHRTAQVRLRRSSYLALREVACNARDDVVYLHGRLPSYFLKQVAQEIAAGVEGVRRVINRIVVLRPARPGSGGPG